MGNREARGGTAAGSSPLPHSPFPILHSRPHRIALIAGEASGDLLGAGLARSLRRRFPDAELVGVCGPAMIDAGVEAWYDCSELAVMGLAEVLRHLPRLLRLRSTLLARLLAWRPDVVVGIDAPDFNLGLERRLKRAGVATVHYVSPSVWAWRAGRAAKIGRSADRVLCLFPMEPPIYAAHGIDARFVGHPLADALPLDPDRAAARAALGLAQDVPVLAVLPGSRSGEIARLGRIFLDAAARVAHAIPNLHLLIPAANEACHATLHNLLSHSPFPIPHSQLLNQQAHQAMLAADVVLLASGTAALEALFAKRPMVVGYRVSAPTAWLVRIFGLLKVDRVSLPNALAGEALVPELLQEDCTAANLASAVRRWFERPEAVAALLPRYRSIHESLRRDASERAAEAIAELLQQ